MGCHPRADGSLTFATLGVGNVGLILVNRSWRLSIWRSFKERVNHVLFWILGVAATLLIALLAVPGARDALHFGRISWTDGLIALGAGFVGVLWFEAYKAFAAARQRDRTA